MPKEGIYLDYDLLANKEVKQGTRCIVCGEVLHCRWSDLHGEGVCLTCGTPYQLLHYDGNGKRVAKEPSINIRPKYVPKLQEYWLKFNRPMSLGRYMGWNPEPENFKAFNEWMEKSDTGV